MVTDEHSCFEDCLDVTALDQVVATPGALALLVDAGLRVRRVALRWIEVEGSPAAEVVQEELRAQKLRIVPVYALSDGHKLWLIVEA